MTSRLDAVVVHAQDPVRVSRFWSEPLGRDLETNAYADVLPGADGGFRLRILPSSEPRSGLNKLHLHRTATIPRRAGPSPPPAHRKISSKIVAGWCRIGAIPFVESARAITGTARNHRRTTCRTT